MSVRGIQAFGFSSVCMPVSVIKIISNYKPYDMESYLKRRFENVF